MFCVPEPLSTMPTPGTVPSTSPSWLAPASRSTPSVNAAIEMGTSISLSLRFCAVTTTSSRLSLGVATDSASALPLTASAIAAANGPDDISLIDFMARSPCIVQAEVI